MIQIMVQLPIFMDNNSTTRVDPRVLEAMLPFFSEQYGNAASRHHVFGWKAEEAVEAAREQVAKLIGASTREIVFTSGATESNNLALKGTARIQRPQGNHIITVQTEHKAVLDPCKSLEREGFAVTYLPVDTFGRVTPEQVEKVITDKTILVSVMAANNEVGSLQPIKDIGRLCKERRILFHTDAAQMAGKLPFDVEDVGADLVSLSAHKMYGPKGIGALYVRRRDPHVRLEPIIDGGGHERGMRSGTLPVPLIVALGKASDLSFRALDTEPEHLRKLRDKLHAGITNSLDDVSLNGHATDRLPGNLNLSFGGVKGDALLMALRTVAVSSGSACTSANPEPSYVLLAMGVPDDLAHASIRFGLGRFTTEEEVAYVVEEIIRNVRHLRSLDPLYEAEKKNSLAAGGRKAV